MSIVFPKAKHEEKPSQEVECWYANGERFPDSEVLQEVLENLGHKPYPCQEHFNAIKCWGFSNRYSSSPEEIRENMACSYIKTCEVYQAYLSLKEKEKG